MHAGGGLRLLPRRLHNRHGARFALAGIVQRGKRSSVQIKALLATLGAQPHRLDQSIYVGRRQVGAFGTHSVGPLRGRFPLAEGPQGEGGDGDDEDGAAGAGHAGNLLAHAVLSKHG
jgi:hypothetical protein